MRIQSLSLGGDCLAHRIPPDPATYLLINSGQIVYCGVTSNLLQRIYKHLSKGLIPRDRRSNWMVYFWDIRDPGLEAVYIKLLRPVANRNGRRALVFHDYCDWVEEVCEAYFLRKPLCLVRSLTRRAVTPSLVKHQASIKDIWQTVLNMERDYLWLSSTFPWHDATFAKWQRVVSQVELMIRRGATTDHLLSILQEAIAEPPKIPALETNQPKKLGRPPNVISSSLIV